MTDRTDPVLAAEDLRDACAAIAEYLHREFGTKTEIDATTPIADLGVDSIELVEMIVTLLAGTGDTDVDLDATAEMKLDRVGDLAEVLVAQGWHPAP